MMFTDNTVLVIGAGASYELGMPLGVELKEQIDKHLNKNDDFKVNLKKALALSASVDNLFEARKGHERATDQLKCEIAHVLLFAELFSIVGPLHGTQNPITPDTPPKVKNLDDSWLIHFFQYLVGGNKLQENVDKLTIINFNYDRCLEEFLKKSESEYFGTYISKPGINQQESKLETDRLKQLRPYGKLTGKFGSIPEEETNAFYDDTLSHSMKNITTFSEKSNDDTKLQVRETLANAQSIIFLGFAFHPQNMEYLDPRRAELTNRQNPAIYATAYRMSKPAAAQIQSELMAMFNAKPDQVHVRNDLTCAKLMQEYGRPPYQFTPS